MKRLPIIGSATLLLLLAATTRADIGGFGNFSGFTVNVNDSGNAPTVSSGTIHLINGGGEHRSIFYNTPQNISQFTASFTYVATYAGAYYGSPGFCFVLQNSPAGASSVTAGAYAYDGLPGKSLAVTFESNNYSFTSGYYTNGTIGNGSLSTSPVDLFSGDPINVTLTYDGSFLHESLLDTTTLASYGTSYLILTPFSTVLGGSTAYVGLTAGNGSYGDDQSFSNFQFTTGSVPEPASLSLLAIPAALLLMRRRLAAVRG